MLLYEIDYVAIIVAAVGAFIIGSIYYGALSKRWMKAVRISEDTEPKMGINLFLISFVGELVLAIMIASVVELLGMGQVTMMNGLLCGFFLWFGIIMPTMTINNRYQNFGWDLTIIDGIHWLLVVCFMGLVIGWLGAS